MKRLVTVLGIALALCGCAGLPEPTAPTADVDITQAPTEPEQAYYLPKTPVERATAGSVRVYRLDPSETVDGIAVLDDRLLICSSGSALSVLDSEALALCRQRELDVPLRWDSAAFRVGPGPGHVGFFDPDETSYVVLNSDLITESIFQIPTDSELDPLISADLKTIYYASGNTIRLLNVSTGQSRILRDESAPIEALQSLLFDDSLLCCRTRDPDGRLRTNFISTQDGSLIHSSRFDDQLISWGMDYAGTVEYDYPMGEFRRIITGTRSGSMQMLLPEDDWDSVLFPAEYIALTQSLDQVGLTLRCHDLKTGMETARVVLPQLSEVFTGACFQDGRLWLWNDNSHRFYSWDTEKNPADAQVSALHEFASLTDSHSDSMASCIRAAEALEQKYQIKIAFTEHGNRIQGLDYSGIPDYRPELRGKSLKLLEQALQRFPAEFLDQVGSRTYYGDLHIHLVDGFDPALETFPEGGSVEFIDGGVIINVTMCREIEPLFYLQLGYVMDARIASMSDALDSWGALNPPDFVYGTDDWEDGAADGMAWFADSESTGSSRDDRARLFCHAMMPDQAELFASAHLQDKLRFLCELIRDTYEIPPETDVPWETYLKTE